jgi:hypothetical protein
MGRSVTYAILKREALALPEVEESTSYGTPALKVRGKLMVRLKEDLETTVVRTTWEERERLMALYPTVFYITEHYRKHPWVLLRMPAANLALVRPLLRRAWQLSAPATLLRKRAAQADTDDA